MEPDVAVDPNDLACVLFDVRICLDRLEQRQQPAYSHSRRIYPQTELVSL